MSSFRQLLTVGLATDTGRVREHNEDAAMTDGDVFVVADGMGGHAAGEVASRIVVDALRELAGRPALTTGDVVSQLEVANERILASAAAHPEQAGMGTTTAGLAVVRAAGSDSWAVFNVGDSRVYRYSEDGLRLVTVDHSQVQELLDAGAITEEEMDQHPLRNVITHSLGTWPMGAPDIWVLAPEPRERFLICSDGLSNELSADQIHAIVQSHSDRPPQATADALVGAAVAAGGRDNVTVIVVAQGVGAM